MPQAEESLNQYGFIKFPASIAARLGITEALVLAILDKWINYHKSKEANWKEKPHFVNNHWAVYITIDDLQNQIQATKQRAIRNAIKHLSDIGVIIISHHSRGPYRRTNWYSIDYHKLAELMDITQNVEAADCAETKESKEKKTKNPDAALFASIDAADYASLEAALFASSYNRITTIRNKSLDKLNSCSFQNQEHGSSREELYKYITEELYSDDNFANTVICFLGNYTLRGYGIHPSLSKEILLGIYDEYYDAENRNGIVDKDWEYMIKEYFSQNFKEKCDHRIYHFFTPGVLDNLYHHIADRAV